jgi:hypothetical protein
LLEANILFASAFDEGQKLISPEKLEQAKTIYANFKEIPSTTGRTYALFGFAQCCFILGEEIGEGTRLMTEIVIPSARGDYDTRSETRSKILAQAIELICNKYIGRPVDMIQYNISVMVATISNELTIYSPLLKRNIKKEQFLKSLQVFATT